MRTNIVADKYSEAIFNLACEQHILEEMDADLSYVRSVLVEHKELQAFLGHPIVSAESKRSVLEKIFSNNIGKLALQFLYVMINRGREGYIVAAIDGYMAKSRESRNILEAIVRVVAPLQDAEREKLQQKIESLTGKQVELTFIVDPAILGGMIIQIGDKRIDASVARSLKEMEKSLLKDDMTEIGVKN